MLELSHPAKIEGQTVPVGRYGLFFVLNKDDTSEVILSKDSRAWGSFFYEPSHDQLRAKIQIRSIAPVELLTCDFINLTKNSAELVSNWEKKQFPVKIEFAVDDIVMANAAEELKGPIGFNWQGPSSAAQYALQNKTNLEQATVWIDQSIDQNRSFATLSTKAGLLKQMGKTAEADKITQESLETATEVELNQYGYQLLNNGQKEEAIKIMMMNTERHSQSANAWDSLGEAYAQKGDKVNAIKSFKKSLTLNPNAGTKANSEKFLKQLQD